MVNDKLSMEERRRLEALNQSIQSMPRGSTKEIIERSQYFDHYIQTGECNIGETFSVDLTPTMGGTAVKDA